MFPKPNTVFGAIKPKCPNRIAKIGYGHLKHQQKTKPKQWKLKIWANTDSVLIILIITSLKKNNSLTRPFNALYVVVIGLDLIWFDFLCLRPLSVIFQLYHGDSFRDEISRSSRRELPNIGKKMANSITAAASRVHLFCNLQSWGQHPRRIGDRLVLSHSGLTLLIAWYHSRTSTRATPYVTWFHRSK